MVVKVPCCGFFHGSEMAQRAGSDERRVLKHVAGGFGEVGFGEVGFGRS